MARLTDRTYSTNTRTQATEIRSTGVPRASLFLHWQNETDGTYYEIWHGLPALSGARLILEHFVPWRMSRGRRP